MSDGDKKQLIDALTAFQATPEDLAVDAYWAQDDARWAESVTYNDGGAWWVLVHPGDRQPFMIDPDEARVFAQDLMAAADEAEAGRAVGVNHD